jgi:hypothetical protein
VLKIKSSPKGFGREMAAEVWMYPDDSRVLELSTKCAPSEAFQATAETRAFLAERGIAFAEEPLTKTRKALDFFSERLRAADGKGEKSRSQAGSASTRKK